MKERTAGYESAMKQAGLTAHVVSDVFDPATTKKTIEQMFRRKGSRGAIFSLNQITTEIVLNLRREA